MKKNFVKIASLLLVMVLVTAAIPVTAHASYTTQYPESGNCVRIRYAVNDKYLDVPTEGLNDNGTQLQVWSEVQSALWQNQIFCLIDTGSGYKIQPMSDRGKVIEVRNSSHDDWAEVAQWENHDGACARWKIMPNNDGSVSFKNCESELLMNVCGGGNAGNGTSIIQYHDDGTAASHFFLEVLDYTDLQTAFYEEDSSSVKDQIWWQSESKGGRQVLNMTGYSYSDYGQTYYPQPGNRVFIKANYIDTDSISNYLDRFNSDVEKALKRCMNGSYDGVIVYTYVCFDSTTVTLSDGSTAEKITRYYDYELEEWDKNSFPLPEEAQDGSWHYHFR